MDITNTLIRQKKQNKFIDITERVKCLEKGNKYFYITFKDGKEYTIKHENIIIEKKYDSINAANFIIKYKDKLKTDITSIEIYVDESENKTYKVFCENGFNFVCEPKDIVFSEFTDSNKKLIRYWKSCACEENENIIKNMLRGQYDKLIVDPTSVLYFYINKLNDENKVDENIICPFNFNNSQIKAIRSALSNKISVIKGPPGTGKTQTILNIICNLITKGKSVAIISANNMAIKNIEDKLNNSGYKFIFASLGNGERKAEFFDNKHDSFQTIEKDDISISSKKLLFLSKLFESECEFKRLNEEIESIKLEQKYYEKFNHESITNVDKYKFKDSQSLINYVTRYQEDTKGKKFNLFFWLKLIFKYGMKESLARAKDRDKIITSLEYKYYSLKLSELSKELEELNDILKANKLDELKLEFKTLSKAYLDHYVYKNIDFQLEFTQKDYKKRFSDFIKRYPIITSTAISFMTSIESRYMLDYVIIDESSQVSIPSAIPLLNKCKNLVVVGDDKQLSPIGEYKTNCDFDENFDSNKQSLMTSFMKIYSDKVTTLLEHYRCDPLIIGFCNLKYYNNQLIPFTIADKENSSLNVVFTSEGNHMRKINDGCQNGVYNQREIDTIEEILNDKFKNSSYQEIGIISPYRLQADKLQNKYPDIECDTIHKFQGREKNFIIFSSVLDSKAIKYDFSFVDRPDMINVAVSRAVKKFILVANEEAFKEKGKEIHDLINYISYKSMNENLNKSKCVSIFDYLYKSKESERNKLLENSNSKSKYESEKLAKILLDNLISLEPYKQFAVQEQVIIKNIITSTEKFNEEEITYIKNRCSVDFLIKDKVSQDIVCVIEVDGVKFHENNRKQQINDALKNSILSKCNIPLIRLKTNGSNDDIKIKQVFNDYLNKFNS